MNESIKVIKYTEPFTAFCNQQGKHIKLSMTITILGESVFTYPKQYLVGNMFGKSVLMKSEDLEGEFIEHEAVPKEEHCRQCKQRNKNHNCDRCWIWHNQTT